MKGLLLLIAALLSACGSQERGGPPPPRELTSDAIGYFCHMIVVNHKGPKGHIFLTDREEPFWFTSVRDTLAFTRLPGEPKNISAIYVTDAGNASWDRPEPGTWIDATTAWYVVGSDRVGGMGAPEVVPFKDRDVAETFTDEYGGQVFDYAALPPDAVLDPAIAAPRTQPRTVRPSGAHF